MKLLRRWVGMQLLAPLALVLALPTGSALAQATTTTTNIRFPLTAEAQVPCALGGAGETVRVSGTAQIVVHTTTDAAGGVHILTHSTYQGFSGTGLTSGDRYRGIATETSRGYSRDLAPTVSSISQAVQFVGEGPRNNFVVHFVYHVTRNANGELTASLYELRVECR